MALLDVEKIRQWLNGGLPYLLAPDDQDTSFLIASTFTARQLIDLFYTPGAIASRRDEITFAIGVRLECLLDPDESSPENLPPEAAASELEELTTFVCRHWPEFVAVDQRVGFGADFDQILVPYIDQQRNRH